MFLCTGLAQEELKLLEAAPLIYGYITKPPRPNSPVRGIPSLVSWVHANQRLSSLSSTEPSEHVLYWRLRHLRRAFSGDTAKRLTQEELQLLEAVPLLDRFVMKPRAPSPLAGSISFGVMGPG
ncbi:unnamed protein product [Polarella glacialis]|uniref:Uncharacterized protein n=1 Tax=Polarella glacialis TaxID=89957 RepID=A0A813G2H6_POLGL|nr:unnamed protein product [Polarella glacialis]